MKEPGAEQDIERGLSEVRSSIAEAASRVGRDPSDVTLIAVSKGGVTAAEILAAVREGQGHFGENRVQEGWAKFKELEVTAESTEIVWHFIGRLQRNKVSKVLEFASYIHSVDRIALAEKIHKENLGGKPEKVMIEVNLSGETAKAGVSEAELPEMIERTLELSHLEVAGLMTMPPLTSNPETSRPYFRRLYELREELSRSFPSLSRGGIRHLSMGMSQDYAVAVEEGATMVRVGRAIFGR